MCYDQAKGSNALLPMYIWVRIDVKQNWAKAPRRTKRDLATLRLCVSAAGFSLRQEDIGGCLRDLLGGGAGDIKSFGECLLRVGQDCPHTSECMQRPFLCMHYHNIASYERVLNCRL